MGWLTTTLILLPMGGALAVWVLPMPRFWIGGFALLVSLAEVGLWIDGLVSFLEFLRGPPPMLKDHSAFHIGPSPIINIEPIHTDEEVDLV